MKPITALIFCISLATLCGANAQAQVIEGSSPKNIASLAKTLGYDVRYGLDSENQPKIAGRISRSDFHILFYECILGENCAAIQFHASYVPSDTISLERLNTFNSEQRYGKAFRAEGGEIVLKYDINLDGGITEENFEDTLDIWAKTLNAFEKHIGWIS